jgi:hypothetical protein
LIRRANAEFVVEKTLASGLADVFSQYISAWQAKRKPVFFKKISGRSRAICVAAWAMGVHNPVRACL